VSETILERLELDETTIVGTTASSEYLGSPTFDEVPFHVHVGCNPQLGSYALIERADDDLLHYGRIISGTEENPRADPSRLQRNSAYAVGDNRPRQSDRSPHVTRVMTIEILGEIRRTAQNELEVAAPSVLAQTGQRVFEIPATLVPWLLGLPTDKSDGLHIGRVDSGRQSVDFLLPMEALARHIVVAGKTGVGKSYALGVLMEELVEHQVPIISFDVLGDVTNAAEALGGKNYRAGTDLKVPYSVIGLSEFLSFMPNLTKDQTELVALAYDTVFSTAMDALQSSIDGTGIDVSLSRLTSEIEEVALRFGQEAVGKRATQRVNAAFRSNRLLSESSGEWTAKIPDLPIVNIFIGHLGQNQRNLIVGAAARMLQILRRRNQIPPFVFFLDEAHLFLPSGGETTPSTGVIRELIRTARHDAIGVVLATQSPSSMDRQVFLTCNTRWVFALDTDDLRLVSGTMGDMPDEVLKRIPKMGKGTAIVSSGIDIMRHAAVTKIRERRSPEGAPTPNLAKEVRKWRQQKRN